jgi:iron complex outermembrane receptor protein
MTDSFITQRINGLAATVMLIAAAPAAFAQTSSPAATNAATPSTATADATAATALPAVNVKAANAPTLERDMGTGSHLGLTALETPASVETIDHTQLATRGDHSIIDAVSRATGISQLAHPGNGGSALGARGFTDSASVTQLYNGVRPYGAIGVTFPFDTWSVDHIDVLRGPASVIYGEGAIGGVVNIVPKLPTRTPIENEIQLGVGTERTARAAFGSGGTINDRLSYRFDVSGNRSANWVDAGNSRDLSYSAALRFDLNPRLYFTLTQAQGFQHPMQYFGIPLINGGLDHSLFSKNYNVGDGDITYRDSWTTLSANWQPTENLKVTSTLYRMQSNRHWKNAEYYTWVPTLGQIERSSYTEILHDQTQYGNVTSATLDSVLFGLHNTASVGFEVNHTTFQHDNNSPYSGDSYVDPYNFASGSFVNVAGTYPKYRSQSNQYAAFAEDRLAITSRWTVIGGVRYDHASVNRDDLINGGGFTRTYANTGWRAGTVYALNPDLAVYAQYSVAADPVSSLLMLNSSSANYKLATGKQIEIGAKQTFWHGDGDWTLAAYRIVKNNLVTTDPLNPNQSIQVGQQSSRGIEASLGLKVLPTLRVDANVAVLRAKFDDYSESTSQGTVSRDGNVPTDVPQRLANLWVSWQFQPQWTSTLGMKYVGKRFADAANQLSMGSYTTFDAALAWKMRPDTTVTARVFNMFNRRYVETAYYDQTQWLLGNDRRFELVLNHRF